MFYVHLINPIGAGFMILCALKRLISLSLSRVQNSFAMQFVTQIGLIVWVHFVS